MSDKKNKNADGKNKGTGAKTAPAETSKKAETTEVSETTESAAAEETATATETTVDSANESTTETTTTESQAATEENSDPKVGDVVETENGKETHGAGYDAKAGKYTPAPAPEPEKKAEPEASAATESSDGFHILTESDMITNPMWGAAGLKVGDKVAPLPKTKTQEDENAEMINHTITPEDMQNYPELADEGLKVGDTVRIPKDAASLVEKAEAKTSTETKTETAPAVNNAAAPTDNEVIYQIAVTGESLRKMFDERQKTTLPAFSEQEVRKVVGDLEPLMLKYQLEKSEDQKGFAVVLEDADSKLRIPTEGFYPLGIDYSQPAVK